MREIDLSLATLDQIADELYSRDLEFALSVYSKRDGYSTVMCASRPRTLELIAEIAHANRRKYEIAEDASFDESKE